MFRKYENFIKSKEKNIFKIDKAKNENSFNKNIINQNRNNSKNKNRDKYRSNKFKTINILHNNKKYSSKDYKEVNFLKNNKNEKNNKLSLCNDLLSNIRYNNINNIKNYKNNLNNKLCTYNCMNNNSSNDDNKKENRKNIKRDKCHWTKKIKSKNRKKKNLSQINITNLINNKYRINNSSLTKTKSTENINLTKNIYNKSSDYDLNIKNIINKKILLYENNFKFINDNNSNRKNSLNKKNVMFNKNFQIKNINKIIKTNYNIYKSISKSNKKLNIWTNNPGNKNIYKNSENFLSCKKTKKICKTPITQRRLFYDIYHDKRINKKKSFNIYLLDNICEKAKYILEKCRISLEKEITNKKFS